MKPDALLGRASLFHSGPDHAVQTYETTYYSELVLLLGSGLLGLVGWKRLK